MFIAILTLTISFSMPFLIPFTSRPSYHFFLHSLLSCSPFSQAENGGSNQCNIKLYYVYLCPLFFPPSLSPIPSLLFTLPSLLLSSLYYLFFLLFILLHFPLLFQHFTLPSPPFSFLSLSSLFLLFVFLLHFFPLFLLCYFLSLFFVLSFLSISRSSSLPLLFKLYYFSFPRFPLFPVLLTVPTLIRFLPYIKSLFFLTTRKREGTSHYNIKPYNVL